MWTCPKCKESIEDHFDSCWRCAQEPQPQPAEPSEAEALYERDIDVIVEGVREIRRRKNTVWILVALFLPLFLVAQLVGQKVLLYSTILYMVICFAAGLRLTAVRCPRCGEFFHSGLSPWRAWRGKCGHCRLALDNYAP